MSNQTSGGNPQVFGFGFFSVGSNNTTLQTPYGVDVVDLYYSGQTCYFDGLNTYCYPDNYASPTLTPAIVTLSSTGQVIGTNGTIPVGNQPTAIKAYGSADVSQNTDPYGGYQTIQQPSNAIVTNFGSNTVSILDLINNAVVHTISVGTQPITVVLNSNQSKAYVANYGSSTVSVIDLGTNTQTNVITVGQQPAALALDPGGSALWVGGLNFIKKFDLGTWSTLQSLSVSGQVTSVAVSAGQGSVVYTTMATANGSSTFQAQQAAISNGGLQGTYAQYTMSSSAYYAEAVTSGGSAPGAPGWLMTSGALVSANYGNGAAVVGTPTGFVVIDLTNHTQILQATTPNPVRGIATDPQQGMIYVTVPDSNSYLSVPMPLPDSHPYQSLN